MAKYSVCREHGAGDTHRFVRDARKLYLAIVQLTVVNSKHRDQEPSGAVKNA